VQLDAQRPEDVGHRRQVEVGRSHPNKRLSAALNLSVAQHPHPQHPWTPSLSRQLRLRNVVPFQLG
jgi:hypothetical protein